MKYIYSKFEEVIINGNMVMWIGDSTDTLRIQFNIVCNYEPYTLDQLTDFLELHHYELESII
jgi:hypothetical protein